MSVNLEQKFAKIAGAPEPMGAVQGTNKVALSRVICKRVLSIWLFEARSVVQRPVRALDSNFSNTFSLFQLLQTMLAIHIL